MHSKEFYGQKIDVAIAESSFTVFDNMVFNSKRMIVKQWLEFYKKLDL